MHSPRTTANRAAVTARPTAKTSLYNDAHREPERHSANIFQESSSNCHSAIII